MKLLWFPRLYADIDRLHMTTWREMGRCLREMGHELRIALSGSGADLEPDFFPVASSQSPLLRMMSFWRSGRVVFRRQVRDFKPDAAILDVYTYWFAAADRRVQGRPALFLDNRSPAHHASPAVSAPLRTAFGAYLKRCYARARRDYAGVTVITDFYRDLLVRRHNLDPDFVGVWGSGVDPERFFPGVESAARGSFDISGKFVVLHHGELSFNRGLLESVEAMKFVESRDLVLLLVGEGPARPALQSLINRLKLGNRVFIRPAVPYAEVPAIVRSSSAGLLAYPEGDYWNANNPIKLLEYMACGKPVVTTGLWTFRSVLGRKGAAVFIESDAPSQIAAGLETARKRSAAEPGWGRENAVLAREQHTWRRQAERLAAFIEMSIGRRRAAGGCP